MFKSYDIRLYGKFISEKIMTPQVGWLVDWLSLARQLSFQLERMKLSDLHIQTVVVGLFFCQTLESYIIYRSAQIFPFCLTLG